MIRQAYALLLLKFHLFRSSFGWAQALGCIMALGMVSLMIAASIFVALLLRTLTRTITRADEPLLLLAAMDALCVLLLLLWIWQTLVELQRPDFLDLRKLLHFPVRRPMIYLANVIASAFNPLLALFTFGMAGIISALPSLTIQQRATSITLSVFFFLMLVTTTMWVRAALTRFLMRRSRKVLLALLVLPMMLTFQAVTPLLAELDDMQEFARRMVLESARDEHRLWLDIHRWTPPLWLPLGVFSAWQGDLRQAAVCCAGMAGIALFFLAAGYRVTLRQALSAAPERSSRMPRRIPWTSLRLWPLANETAALVSMTILSYARNPQVQMLLTVPLVLGAFLIGIRTLAAQAAGLSGPLIAALLLTPLMGYGVLFFNQFGTDGPAFRNYLVMPVPRYRILLAKNLALLPLTVGLGAGFLLVLSALQDISRPTVYTALLLLIPLHFAYCLAGNYFSIFIPHRVQRRPGAPGLNRFVQLLIGMMSVLISWLLLVPALFILAINNSPPDWWPAGAPPAGAVAAGCLGLTLAFLWFLSLRHAGDLLAEREQVVALALSQDRE